MRTRPALHPRKAPRQTRSRATVDVILQAAARVFGEVGYAAGTTNRIAERAGVSVGSLYQYFPNKDALLAALMDAHVREGEAILLATAAEPLPPSLDDLVRRFVRTMVDLHARDAALHRVLFEQMPLPRQTRRLLAEAEARVLRFVVAALAAHPEVRTTDLPRAAALVVQVVEHLTHRHVLDDAPNDDTFVDEVTTLVTGYLRAAPRPPASRPRSSRTTPGRAPAR